MGSLSMPGCCSVGVKPNPRYSRRAGSPPGTWAAKVTTSTRPGRAARFTASVDLGQDGAPWTYRGRLSLHGTGSGWKIDWSPSVINPGLRPGLHLAMVSTTPRRRPLLDAAGRPLETPSTAYLIGVRPDRLHHPAVTAQRLGEITGLQSSELLGWILAAPGGSFAELVVLKPGHTQTAEDLIAYCRRSLASYKVPRRVEFSDTDLPKSGSGKILKRVLRERFWANQQRAVS